MNNYGFYQPYPGVQRPMYQMPTQMPYNEQIQQQVQTPMPNYNQPIKQGLQGKMVEGYDVVKGIDISFDGSINYFPSTDGSKIFTKQLQNDGTVKLCTYILDKPQGETEEKINYATKEDLEEYFSSFKEDINEIKKALKKETKKEDKQ